MYIPMISVLKISCNKRYNLTNLFCISV